MHFTLSTIAFMVAALLPMAAQANFDVYRVEWIYINRPSIGWQFFEAEPRNCDQVINTPVWEDHGDVSGSRLGVRCEGSGCGPTPPPNDIDELEIHTSNNPLYHWTLYKDRGRSMVGLDGNTYGNCIVFPNGDYNCPVAGQIFRIEGRRKFRCLTRFTAAQLNSNARVPGDAADADAPPLLTFAEYIDVLNGKDISNKTAVSFTS
ncbi:Small secreted protein [Madurella fahalii]|uniref:Small secreted protein n=1 Tax=Madurella fahalii TaxID=1157608 RepID=A0ABQ0G763_9PEZI